MQFNQAATTCSLLIGMPFGWLQLAIAPFQFPIYWEFRKCIDENPNCLHEFQHAIAPGCKIAIDRYDSLFGVELLAQKRMKYNQNERKIRCWRNLLGRFARSTRQRTTRQTSSDYLAGVGIVRKPANGNDNTSYIETWSVSAAGISSHRSNLDKRTITSICRPGFSACKLRQEANRATTWQTRKRGFGCSRTSASPTTLFALKTLLNNFNCFVADFLPCGKLVCKRSVIREVIGLISCTRNSIETDRALAIDKRLASVSMGIVIVIYAPFLNRLYSKHEQLQIENFCITP